MNKCRYWPAALAGTVLSAACSAAPAHFSVTTDATNGCYAVGATATVEVGIKEKGRHPKGPVEAWADDGWTNVVWRRTVDMAQEPTFKFTLTRATPGTLRIHLRGAGMREKLDRVVFGVDAIRPLTPFPVDFKSYWKGEWERLEREVPAAVDKTPAPALDTPGTSAFYVSVATFGGGRIYGILSVPKGDGPFPVCVTVPGAGAGRIAPQHSRAGWISLTINIHGFPIGKTKAEQKERFEAWQRALAKESGEPKYQRFGFAAGRDKPFYHNTILGMVRMLEWLAKEPYADAARFVYLGGSQGGGFGLYLTSAWRGFSKSLIFFPNMCDMLAYREGRQPGSEHILNQTPEHRPAAEQTGPYYDACNFARLIHTPVRMIHGLSDENCNTEGGIAAFNALASKDKELLLVPGLGHRWLKDTEYERWLFADGGMLPLPPCAGEMIPRIVVKGPLDAMAGHVQGACASKDAIYFSHVAGIFKIDWNGNVLKHVPATRHTGDLCYHDGKLYSVLGTWGSGGQTKICRLQIWDADLNFLSERDIPGLVGMDGVTVLDGILYHGIGKGSSDPHASHALGRIDLKTLEPLTRLAFELPYRTHFGPQNLTTDGTSLFMAFYPVKGAPYAISACDKDGRLIAHYALRAGQGFERLPKKRFPGAHPRFFKVSSRGGKQKDGTARPPSVTIDFYELADGAFRNITKVP